jgi:hypothetical protein
MNERIRELALQANGPNPFYGTLKNQMTLLGDDAVEKFAELIVKECARAIINDKRLNDVRSAANGCVRTIREHFGVEE